MKSRVKMGALDIFTRITYSKHRLPYAQNAQEIITNVFKVFIFQLSGILLFSNVNPLRFNKLSSISLRHTFSDFKNSVLNTNSNINYSAQRIDLYSYLKHVKQILQKLISLVPMKGRLGKKLKKFPSYLLKFR